MGHVQVANWKSSSISFPGYSNQFSFSRIGITLNRRRSTQQRQKQITGHHRPAILERNTGELLVKRS